jgi:hypothetical protein
MKPISVAGLLIASLLAVAPAAILPVAAYDGGNVGGGGSYTVTDVYSCGYVVVPLLSPVVDGLFGFLFGWATVNVLVWECSSSFPVI